MPTPESYYTAERRAQWAERARQQRAAQKARKELVDAALGTAPDAPEPLVQEQADVETTVVAEAVSVAPTRPQESLPEEAASIEVGAVDTEPVAAPEVVRQAVGPGRIERTAYTHRDLEFLQRIGDASFWLLGNETAYLDVGEEGEPDPAEVEAGANFVIVERSEVWRDDPKRGRIKWPLRRFLLKEIEPAAWAAIQQAEHRRQHLAEHPEDAEVKVGLLPGTLAEMVALIKDEPYVIWNDRLVTGPLTVDRIETIRPWEPMLVAVLSGNPAACAGPNCTMPARRLTTLGVGLCDSHAAWTLRPERVPVEQAA